VVCGSINAHHFNPLQTKRRPLYLKTQSVPRCKHSISVIKGNQLMLYGTEVAVCSQINTKHKYSVGRAYSCWMLNCWCITWPVGFRRLNFNQTNLVTSLSYTVGRGWPKLLWQTYYCGLVRGPHVEKQQEVIPNSVSDCVTYIVQSNLGSRTPRIMNSSVYEQIFRTQSVSDDVLCLELRTRKPSTVWSDKLAVSVFHFLTIFHLRRQLSSIQVR